MSDPVPDARKAEILSLAESTPNRTLIPVGEAAALVREIEGLKSLIRQLAEKVLADRLYEAGQWGFAGTADELEAKIGVPDIIASARAALAARGAAREGEGEK